MSREINIFISYSHLDDDWHERLKAFLDSLKFTRLKTQDLKSGNLYQNARFQYRAWSDKQIDLGSNWKPEIEDAIRQARVAVLLVSTDFLASEFILEQELPLLIDRSNSGELAIFPLIIRPCLWRETAWLQEIQIFDSGQAMSELPQHEWEKKLVEFSLRIDEQLESERSGQELVDEEAEIVEEIIAASISTQPIYTEPFKEKNASGNEFYTWNGVRKLIDESGFCETGEYVADGLLLFRTVKQRTWFAVTQRQLFCVLDGEKTRKRGRLIQWHESLSQNLPVRARDRANAQTGLLNVGTHVNWLYSKRLHKSPGELEAQVTKLLENA
ncbi:hypothetical protein DJ031_02300 [bacterium endosymbiont of Escarpia laminata]|nr:MAG: hypothetical protein DJ031_02300 [bacterium endosymbiont of Escarpia laminata]